MPREHLALLAVLGASFTFSSASVVFARFSREISPTWMNAFKATVCGLCLIIALTLRGAWENLPPSAMSALMISGGIGLGIGDLFLLGAFARIGASRTLMLFGFQPVFVGLAAMALFHQPIEPHRAVAIVFFMACLFFISFERYRRDGHWEWRGLLYALLGVALDNTGVILTRWGFDQAPGLDPMLANFVRVVGALIVFGVIAVVRPFQFKRRFLALPRADRVLVSVTSAVGTFVSLSLYLFALKTGHLASISAVTLSGPVFSATLEAIVQRKPPSRFLLAGLACLFVGMGIFFLT